MKTIRMTASILFAGLTFGYNYSNAPAADSAAIPKIAEKSLHGSFTLYGWYTFVDGQIGIGGLGPVQIGSGDGSLFDILDGFIMANGDLQYGRYGVYGDIIHVGLSDATMASGWELDATSFTAAATYSIAHTPESHFQIMAGGRYWAVSPGVQILPPAGPSASGTEDWTDFIGGVRGRRSIGRSFYIEGTALAGAGGSEFSWDVYAGIGYNFTSFFAGTLGYRGMGVDYDSAGTIIDFTFHGPVAGLKLAF